MSEDKKGPSKQTSSVPLKKETVRVTLKATDAPKAEGGAPPAPAAPKPTAPGAPKPPTAATKPPAPSAPKPTGGGAPPAPAPTIALKPAGAPTAPGAPAPAPTIKLNTPAAPSSPGAATAPGAPTSTVSLPKATVQLQPPTQPLGTAGASPSQAPTIQAAAAEDSEENETLTNALAILGFVAALGLFAFQFMTAKVWIDAAGGGLIENLF